MSGRPEYLKGQSRIVSVRRETIHWLKAQSSRYMRRLARRLLDDAPKKIPKRGSLA